MDSQSGDIPKYQKEGNSQESENEKGPEKGIDTIHIKGFSPPQLPRGGGFGIRLHVHVHMDLGELFLFQSLVIGLVAVDSVQYPIDDWLTGTGLTKNLAGLDATSQGGRVYVT